jgi:pSer/pThr/pTyr-binding forkhead associated (FHA) protein
MDAFVECRGRGAPELVPLTGDRVTVGRSSSNPVALEGDALVSRLHAVFERYSSGWVLRDIGSSNGTYVNGSRLATGHRLLPGDEIRVGETRLVFRTTEEDPAGTTLNSSEPVPDITRRERDVLIALCRPVARGDDPFAEPATSQGIADELVLSLAAVKFHLGNLYDKFAIPELGSGRRTRLANEALRRGAVRLSDLL